MVRLSTPLAAPLRRIEVDPSQDLLCDLIFKPHPDMCLDALESSDSVTVRIWAADLLIRVRLPPSHTLSSPPHPDGPPRPPSPSPGRDQSHSLRITSTPSTWTASLPSFRTNPCGEFKLPPPTSSANLTARKLSKVSLV